MHLEEPDRKGIKEKFSTINNLTPKQYHDEVVKFEVSLIQKIESYDKKLNLIGKKLVNLRKENTKLNENVAIIKMVVEPQLGKKLNLKSAIESTNSNLMVKVFTKKHSVTVIKDNDSEKKGGFPDFSLNQVLNSPNIDNPRSNSPGKKPRQTMLLSLFGNNTNRGGHKKSTFQLETSNLIYQELKDKIKLFVVSKKQIDANSRNMKRLQDETFYYKEKIKITKKEKIIFYKCILKTGIDIRYQGLVWILLQLYMNGEDINRQKIRKTGFPEFLDKLSINFLYTRLDLEIKLIEKNSICKSLFDVYLAKNPDFKSICLPQTNTFNSYRNKTYDSDISSLPNSNSNIRHKKSKVLNILMIV